MSDQTYDFAGMLPPRLLCAFGTSIGGGNASPNGAGASDGETLSGSATNGAFRTDGKQSIIGYGGQVLLGLGLFLGSTAALAMNACVGGSFTDGSTSGNLKPLIGWQDAKMLSSSCLADLFAGFAGTNDMSTSLMSAGEINALVDKVLGTFVRIRDFHLQQKAIIGGEPKDVQMIVANCPPKTSTANEQANVIAYNAALLKAVEAMGGPKARLHYFDLFSPMAKSDGTWRPGFSSDNIHPNGREVAITVAEALETQLGFLLDRRREVRALGQGLDLAEIAGLDITADGTVPETMTAGGTLNLASTQANCFVPPATFSKNETGVSGVELRSVNAAGSCSLKKDVTLFAGRPGATFVATMLAEVIQNSPSASNVTCNLGTRLSWQDSGGSDIGRVGIFSGNEGTFDKVRLSVLFTVPELSGQLTGTMAKGTVLAGALGTAGSSANTRYKARFGDLKFIPVDA